MSATEATVQIFVTAFKSLKLRQRQAVVEWMLADEDISADIADTLELKSIVIDSSQNQTNQLTPKLAVSVHFAFRKGGLHWQVSNSQR